MVLAQKENQDRASVNRIAFDPLMRLRMTLADRFFNNNMTDQDLSNMMEQIGQLYPDVATRKTLVNAKSAIKRGSVLGDPVLVTPAQQFIWAAHLTYLKSHPEKMLDWSKELQGKSLAETQLWKELTGGTKARTEMMHHKLYLSSAINNPDVQIKWGKPGTTFFFNPDENLINIDFVLALTGGLEHTRGAIFHEIGHSQLSGEFPARQREITRLIKEIQDNAKNGKGAPLTKNEYKRVALLRKEWDLRHNLYNVAEDNCVNRYTSIVGERHAQDYSYSTNHMLMLMMSKVTNGREEELERNNGIPSAMLKYFYLVNTVRMGFYKNNGLIDGKSRLQWGLVGVDPDYVPYPGAPEGLSINGLLDMCDGKEGSLGYLQPDMVMSRADRAKGSDFRKQKSTELRSQRNELIEKIFDQYAEPLVQEILKEYEQELEQQLNNKNQNQDSQQKDQQQKQDDNPGLEQDQPPPPQDNPQQQDNQQEQNQQNQEQQNQPQQQEGEKQKGDNQQNQKDQQEQQDNKKQEEQENKSEQNQEQNQKDSKDNQKSDGDEQVPENMPDIEAPPESYEEEQKKNAEKNKEEEKELTKEQQEALEKLLEEMKKELEKEENKKEEGKDQKPAEPKKAENKAGKEDVELKLGDWSDYQNTAKEFAVPINRVAGMLKQIKQRQLQEVKKLSKQRSIIPEDSSLAERYDRKAHQELMIKKQTGRKIEKEDYAFFRTDGTKTEPTQFDLFVWVDGSESMQGKPLQSAIQSACILYEASKNLGINVYVGMWGNDKPVILAKPKDNPHEIGRAIAGANSGLKSETNLAPAIGKATEILSSRKMPPNALIGFSHMLVISDGDISDRAETKEMVKTLLGKVESVTLDVAIINPNEYQKKNDTEMHKLVEEMAKEMPNKDIRVVEGFNPDHISTDITKAVLDRVRTSKVKMAKPAGEKARQARSAMNIINRNNKSL